MITLTPQMRAADAEQARIRAENRAKADMWAAKIEELRAALEWTIAQRDECLRIAGVPLTAADSRVLPIGRQA